ncbi:MAG: hypothetical protein H7249_15070 [Chitinophagaceae bacterium]|nr:hypothetical protein [Oligoflexus sp.]
MITPIAFFLAATAAVPSPAVVPDQNIHKPVLASIEAYDPAPLLQTINGETPLANSPSLFFPADAFDQVKGIKDPGAYHKQLLKWFASDLEREKTRLGKGAPWTVDTFKLGFCKWKEKGTEANALPYWSCYKSKLKLKNAKGENDTLDIRVLINWGTTWYITHLGALPKA